MHYHKLFVLWSMCWSSSFVHYKNCPKYLIRWTTQVFNPLLRFWQKILIPRSFLVRLSYSFYLFFFHLHLQYHQVLVSFLFSKCSDYFLIWQFCSLRCLFFWFLIISMAHLLMPNSIPTSWVYIHIVCIRVWKPFDVIHAHLVVNLF